MDNNDLGGAAFAIWGLIHIGVAVFGIWIYFTGGSGQMLSFVVLDSTVNHQADRMADLIVEFYHALLLIGLTVTAVGLTLNREGDRLGWWINTILVANIEAAFIWFEVIPGNRPVVIAIITVGLLFIGVGAGWRGIRDADQGVSPEPTGDPVD